MKAQQPRYPNEGEAKMKNGPRSLTKFQTNSNTRFTTDKCEGLVLQETCKFGSVTLLLEGRPGTRTFVFKLCVPFSNFPYFTKKDRLLGPSVCPAPTTFKSVFMLPEIMLLKAILTLQL
jgi:hypothetical protein